MADQIDATRIALRTLAWLDGRRRAVDKQWREWTTPGKTPQSPPTDRRHPPDLW